MAKGRCKSIQIEPGTGYPLGACWIEQGKIQFSISLMEEPDCKLHILSGKIKRIEYSDSEFPSYNEQEMVIPVDEKYCIGDVFSIIVPLEEDKEWYYYYEKNGAVISDTYAQQIVGRELWGKPVSKNQIYHKVKNFDLNQRISSRTKISFQELLIYRLHVRGFTKDPSSGVKEKGTYKGVIEKIPYIKSLGINAVELMPCYEFSEVKDCTWQKNYPVSSSITRPYFQEQEDWKLNYWGYAQDNFYFAPKASYAAVPDNCCNEFREMVDALHENGIEVYMEFYFAFNTNQSLIIDCLHFWQKYYQIDGFKVNQEWIPDKLLATDPVLNQAKLFTWDWNITNCYPDGRVPKRKHLADYNDQFMNAARRFLKGDEEQVLSFTNVFKNNPEGKAVINYLSNTGSMTLMDMVSYDVKHNEENGEQNQDGTDYNFSWNCGVEGKTRKKSVLELRKKQIRNALMLLFFSQGVPLLVAGDEFGNSQNGNNNPYCQDNKITWLNWNDQNKNSWILEFTKKCIQFRKQHILFHRTEQLKGMDYISCGCPDISFHGLQTWYPDYTNYSRTLGILLCGQYAKLSRNEFEKDMYIAYNFHWEQHAFSLPNPAKGKKWAVLVRTDLENEQELGDGFEPVSGKTYDVPARTVIMFIET
ncbi:alpha-amylase family glycosyl hydrolase [[Clostridium] polysaccharolyticum]|uniref:Glycogen operon protein n=1 Tax=[Clostridium] polysaccharolyticum TaxID=29364 RepID=A0A1H9YQ16_9FIRM|nr:alpha-amylase family glycosyl hydrolase [[Clostridium] polysaccharolyticum]SES71234.1 glycogen operon protein [[Clostridium] polysaccharolyticum]